MDWIERYAEALGEGIVSGPNERRAMLKLAREVAHRTERMNAPLTTFLAGQYLAVRRAEGASEVEAIREAIRRAERLLPPEKDGPAD
jgi:cob(I)alamin adenosyltransferase